MLGSGRTVTAGVITNDVGDAAADDDDNNNNELVS